MMGNKKISETLVLVVDDNAMSRAVIEHCLKKDGYIVFSASSGVEAISIVNNEKVDLIFLDLLMGGMSGLEVLSKIKSDERFKHIPVVVVSGVEDGAPTAHVKGMGAVDFLPKPVTATTLRKILSEIFGTPLAEISNVGQSPLFEKTRIEQMREDYGKDVANGFITQFEGLASEQKKAITAARDTGNIKLWIRAAHDLKSGARIMGLSRLAAICRDIELACNGERIDDASVSTDALNTHFDDAMNGLHEYASVS